MQHHAGNLTTSERLQRVYTLLHRQGKRGSTTAEINHLCQSTRASSDVSDLRRSLTDKAIVCQFEGHSPNGRKVHRYTMVAK